MKSTQIVPGISHLFLFCCALNVFFLGAPEQSFAAGTGELELRAIDATSKEPVAVRMHLTNARGRRVKVRHAINALDYFVFDGSIVLKLPTGDYQFRMERGPECKIVRGHFKIERGATDNKVVEMHRFVDMAKEGWYSGDTDIRMPIQQMPTYMLAEDLVVGIVKPSSDRRAQQETVVAVGNSRWFSIQNQLDDKKRGSILLAANKRDASDVTKESSYPWEFLTSQDDRRNVDRHVDLLTATHSDLPVWLASGRLNSVGVLNSNINAEKWKSVSGKRPDPDIFELPTGYGRWSNQTYYTILNSGLRIPPTAGSGAGVSNLPVGYNRVYVYCENDFSFEKWWENLAAGKCVITNGPMLRPFANGQPPGFVFQGYEGKTLEIEVELQLATREKISYLQIIKNGRSLHEVRLQEFVKKKGQLPILEFKSSGWFIVRAVCDNAENYRFATSAPFYVEFENKPRISKSACQTLLDWAVERKAQLGKNKTETSQLRFHSGAVNFWKKRLSSANDD